MDATTLLAEDHDLVRELFKEIEELSAANRGERKVLLEELRLELEAHARIEEEIFYPAVRRLPDETARDLVEEAAEQHDEVKLLLEDLLQLGADDPDFLVRLAELQETVDLHVAEEEEQIFPFARARLGVAKLDDLGMQMDALKETLRGASALR